MEDAANGFPGAGERLIHDVQIKFEPFFADEFVVIVCFAQLLKVVQGMEKRRDRGPEARIDGLERSRCLAAKHGRLLRMLQEGQFQVVAIAANASPAARSFLGGFKDCLFSLCSRHHRTADGQSNRAVGHR